MTLWHVFLSFAGLGWAGFLTFLFHISQQWMWRESQGERTMPRSWVLCQHAYIDDCGPKNPQSGHAEHLRALAKLTLQPLNQIMVFEQIERALVPGGECIRSMASMFHLFSEWDQTVYPC